MNGFKLRNFFASALEKAGTTLVVGFLLAIAAGVVTLVSEGWLIEKMGGVKATDFGQRFDTRFAESISAENSRLARKSDLAALETEIATLKAGLKSLEDRRDRAEQADIEINNVLTRLSQSLETMEGYFDGAARIVYYSDLIAICAATGCGEIVTSQFPDRRKKKVNLSVTGSRSFEIDVAQEHGLREPLYILTAWYEIIANEFVDIGGQEVPIEIELSHSHGSIAGKIESAPTTTQAYATALVHYLVAIEDPVRLTAE